MDLNGFILFDPLVADGNVIPRVPGNYLVTIRDIKALPKLGYKIVTSQFRGQELIYTGITQKNLHHRIWNSHLKGHAGRSTLRLTLGCLMGYNLIPRDKHNPHNGKVRFNDEDERELRGWMMENLLFYFQPNDSPKDLENELIGQLNPPLNFLENENPVNQEFRSVLSSLRRRKPERESIR